MQKTANQSSARALMLICLYVVAFGASRRTEKLLHSKCGWCRAACGARVSGHHLQGLRAGLLQQLHRASSRHFLAAPVVPGQVPARPPAQLVPEVVGQSPVLHGRPAEAETGRRCGEESTSCWICWEPAKANTQPSLCWRPEPPGGPGSAGDLTPFIPPYLSGQAPLSHTRRAWRAALSWLQGGSKQQVAPRHPVIKDTVNTAVLALILAGSLLIHVPDRKISLMCLKLCVHVHECTLASISKGLSWNDWGNLKGGQNGRRASREMAFEGSKSASCFVLFPIFRRTFPAESNTESCILEAKQHHLPLRKSLHVIADFPEAAAGNPNVPFSPIKWR